MRNEGAARLEIIIAALFAFVVYLQAQNAHQYATLLQALDRSQSNQAELFGLYRRTFEAARSTPETQPHHFYQEHDEIARNAPRAPTRNLHDRHYTGPCELTLPRPAARIWLQPGMEPKHDHHLGIDCYIKMKNLNKRLYQGASTQHCLWLTGSSTSGAHRRLPAGRRVDCTAAGACLRQAVAL